MLFDRMNLLHTLVKCKSMTQDSNSNRFHLSSINGSFNIRDCIDRGFMRVEQGRVSDCIIRITEKGYRLCSFLDDCGILVERLTEKECEYLANQFEKKWNI